LFTMTDHPLVTERATRPGRRRHPYGELIHFLNQRYHQEWERAEALQCKLARLQRWKILPIIEWVGRIGRHLRALVRHRALDVSQRAILYAPPAALPAPAGLVSIVIPFRDRPELLRNCLRSLSASTYRRFEVILVDNGSTEPRARRLLDRYAARPNVRIVAAPGDFNFARLCNRGAEAAAGEFLLFLNNDTEVLDRSWLEQLLTIAGDPSVGIVGATLLYPDETIQHAGMFRRSDGVWVHPYRGRPADEPGERGELQRARCVPAVTAACMLVRRGLFQSLGGFDERFAVMHNDVDLCARVRQRGLQVVVTPHARLYHYESLSRGYALDEPQPVANMPA
jgi:GT2 family glycosyltransferase